MNKVNHQTLSFRDLNKRRDKKIQGLLWTGLTKGVLFFAAVLVIGTSCRKLPDTEELSTKPMTITNYADKSIFVNYKTYYLPNFIPKINTFDPNDTLVDNTSAQILLGKIRDNMNKLGYTEVESSSEADVSINTLVIKDIENITYITPGWWWPYYYPWYWDYWDWTYYYPFPVTYTYSTGAFLIEMVDLKDKNVTTKTVNVIWNAWSTGEIFDPQTNLSNAEFAIDQSFTQSPYLKTN